MKSVMPHTSHPIGDEATTKQGYNDVDDLTQQGVGLREGPIPSQSQPHPRPSIQFQRSRFAPRRRPPPRRVDHTYHDYSNFPLSEIPGGNKEPTNFPSKLHHILSTPEYSHIISWMPHGRAWKIHNKELLMREVVPKYFVQSKYESFTRQLNGWGFKRLHQSGNDYNSYYHETFLRGLVHLTALMKRVVPNKGKLLPHVEGEPNFYEIEKRFPLPTPVMPYHGQYYSPSHMASAGYGSPPEPVTPTGYVSPVQYSPYPSPYPPPPHFYPSYQTAAPAFPLQLDYPSYPAPRHPTQYIQPRQESSLQYPYYPPDHLYDTQSHNDTSLSKNSNVIITSVNDPLSPSHCHQESVQENGLPTKDDTEDDSFEPLSIFADADSYTTESCDHSDFCELLQR